MGRVGGRVTFKYWSCATFIKVGCLIYSRASGIGFAKAGIEKKMEETGFVESRSSSLFLSHLKACMRCECNAAVLARKRQEYPVQISRSLALKMASCARSIRKEGVKQI